MPGTNQCMGMFVDNKKVGVGNGSVILDCFTKDTVKGTKGQVFLGNRKVDIDGTTQIHEGPGMLRPIYHDIQVQRF